MQDEHGTSDEPGTGTSNLRSLRTTPMRDLARGRVTGRLDLRQLLASSTLPETLRRLVAVVVRRTRLRRLERMDVARELVEHFEDGIEAGASADELAADFGDPRVAATLIRRGMKRKRSWFERAVRRTALVAGLFFAGFVAIYLVFAVRHWNQPVRIDVDYVAKIRAESAGASPEERGWPEIRAAMTELRELAGPADGHRDQPMSSLVEVALTASVPPWSAAVMPSSPEIPADDAPTREACEAFFDRATPLIGGLRDATSKPVLGFDMGVDGGGNEADRMFLGLDPPAPAADPTILDGSVIELQFPYYATIRLATRVLSVDARRAAERGESARFVDDVEAMFGLGRQVRTPTILIGQLVGMSIERLAFATILDVLAHRPEAFDTVALDRLAGLVAGLDDDRLGIRVDAERYFFLDLAQRLYTDDGEGNGRLKFVSAGAAQAGLIPDAGDPEDGGGGTAVDFLVGPLFAGAAIDRREATELWNRNLDQIEAGNTIAPWERDASGPRSVDEAIREEEDSSWFARFRLFPVSMLLVATDGVENLAAALRLERDLVRTVIGIERFRRVHGAWPTSLDELDFVGRDPFDGEPLRYVVRDDAPTIYILGPDRVDDGGTWIMGPNGLDRAAREGLAGTTRFWGRVPRESGDGMVGDVPVWIGGAATDATGGES
jgi:hypothetical protein